MRWPIKNQIVVPFVAVLLAAVATTAITSAILAARRSEQQAIRQLRAVTETLAQSNFPLTGGVLQKVRGLSGAHFVVRDASGSTVETSLPGDAMLGGLLPIDKEAMPATFSQYRNLTLDGVRYFASEVTIHGRQRGASLLLLYPEETLRQARRDAAMPPLAIGAVAMAVMLVVAFWLAHRFSTRIRSVQAQVAAIASGNFREIDAGSRNDEIRELVSSVNQMSMQLRRMRQTIRRTERTQLLGQLAGGLAHQLRNAITGARMALQIHEKRCEAGGNDESLDVACRQLALTEEQLRGMLSLGQQQRQSIAFDARGVVEEVAMLVSPACEHAHVVFGHECDTRECPIVGDPDELRSAILNLAFNALDAAGAGGEFRLAARRRGDAAEIEVADNGCGPPPEVHESLFEPFVTSKTEGVGLGLAVARQAALEHGGSLAWKRSDEWTRFVLFVPLAQPELPGNAVPGGGSAGRAQESQIAGHHDEPSPSCRR